MDLFIDDEVAVEAKAACNVSGSGQFQNRVHMLRAGLE